MTAWRGISAGGLHRRRGFAGAATLLLHGGMFALIWLLAMPHADEPVEKMSVTAFDIEKAGLESPEAPQEEQVETPPTPPEPVIVPIMPFPLETDNPMPVAMIEQETAEGGGGGCDLTGTVQAAMRADPAIEATLPSIAEDRRSVANALALWKGRWVEPDRRLPPEAIMAIRETVQRVIASAPEPCRTMELRGPRLLYVPGQDRTTVLAMGSGRWSWQEVADSAEAETDDTDRRGGRQRPMTPVTDRVQKIMQSVWGVEP